MKISRYAFLLSLVLSGCNDKDDDSVTTPEPSASQALEASLKKWQSEKSGHSSYAYTAGHTYEFEKKSWSTRIAVNNDSVSCRTYEHKELVGNEWKTTEKWSENGSQIGLREVGAPARTLDDIYSECTELIAKHGSQVNVSFFETNGFLKECYLTCQDECYKNIALKEIKFEDSEECR